MKYQLKVLANGMMAAKIIVKNTRSNHQVSCLAMIDTGADVSFICESLAVKLNLHPDDVTQLGASTLDKDVIVPVAWVDVNFPADNWSADRISMFIKDFKKRDEYDALIGMDILKNSQFFYNGITKDAWIDL